MRASLSRHRHSKRAKTEENHSVSETMSILYLNDLDKVCRGCLSRNGEMRPLFGSYLDNMLRMVAEIEVQVGDGLPQMMCVPCVLQVSRAFTFKQQCQRSDSTLRTFFQEMEKSNDDAANLAIDLNAVRAIQSPKEMLNTVECNATVVLDSGGQIEQVDDVAFNEAPDGDNLDEKCLLIVHSVPSTLMASDLSGSMDLEDTDGMSSVHDTFISVSDLIEEEQHVLEAHNGEAGVIVEEIDNDMDEQHLDVDLIAEHFGEKQHYLP